METEGEQGAKTSEEKRDKIGHWIKWITDAERAAKCHWDDAESAWKEYDFPEGTRIPETHCNPKYWSSCKTLEPAYFSRSPEIIVRRRFDINDPVALTASTLTERLAKYLIEKHPITDVMAACTQDFIHADKTTTQVIYTGTASGEKIRKPLTANEDGTYVDGESEYMGEVLQDLEGPYYEEDVIDGDVMLKSVPYNFIIHTPHARTWDEIQDIGYKFQMPKEEAEKRFNPDGTKTLSYRSIQDDKEDGSKLAEIKGEVLEGYEIFSKALNKTFWVSKDNADEFLDVQEDIYGLAGFFPSPKFIISNKPSKHLYPVPAYVRLKPTIEQLHMLRWKGMVLTRAIDPKCLVDAATPELIMALRTPGPDVYVPVTNMRPIVDQKGGLESMMLFTQVLPLVDSMMRTVELEAKFTQDFDDSFGVPDVLRGASDPVETATAIETKRSAAHDRFKYSKAQIAELARASIEMMVDLALQVFSPDKIRMVCGWDYLPDEDQKMQFEEALAFLKNDTERCIRIDIETDSTSFINEERERAIRRQDSEAMVQSLGYITSMLKEPGGAGIANIAAKILIWNLTGTHSQQQFENPIMTEVDNLIAEATKPPEGPPPPDPAMEKLALEREKFSFEAQAKLRELDQKDAELTIKQQEQQADNQLEIYKAQVEERFTAMASQVEQAALQIEQYKAQISDAKRTDEQQKTVADIAQKQSELAVQAEDMQQANEVALLKIESERQKNAMAAEMEGMRVMLERQRVQIEEVQGMLRIKETLMEEQRHRDENKMRAVEIIANAGGSNESKTTD